MADGNGPGRITIAGLAFAFMMLVLIVVSLWLFIARPWWFPQLASVRGGDINRYRNCIHRGSGRTRIFRGAVWFERNGARGLLA